MPNYRTSNSKRFLNPNGTMTEEIYMGNVHYRKNGQWEDIDNTLVPSDDPDFKFKNKANRFEVSFPDNNNGNSFTRFAMGDRAVEMRPIGLLTSSGLAKGNKITYTKGQPGNGLPVALEYNIGYDSLKEDIILDQYQKVNRLTFQLRLTNVTYKVETDGTIGFYDKDKGHKLWFFNRPYMVDSGKGENEGYSDAVTMSVREEGNNLFVDLVPDDAWLKDPARVYPVRIDPSITLQPNPSEGRDTHISQYYANSNYATSTFLSTGYDSSGGLQVTRALLWFRLPALPSGSWISSATLSLYQYGSFTTTPTVQAYRITSDWSSGSVNWNSQPTLNATAEDSLTQNIIGWYNFNVSNAAMGWYTGGLNNYGLALKLSNEGVQRRLFYSSDYATDPTLRPKLVINYDVNPLGEESFWTYEGDVHVATGNLMLSYTDIEIPGRGIPASLSRTYNSRSSYDEGTFGYGWNSELDMKITPVVKGPIQYIDPDRTVHYFEQLADGTYKSPPGLYLTLDKNGDGTYTVTEKNGLKYNFSNTGRIASIIDTQGNTLKFYPAVGKITSIEDPSKRTITIAYGANNRVSTVTDYAGRQTTYGYNAAGDLTQVTEAAGTADAATTYFEYDAGHNLISITDPKGNKTYYYYTADDRVQSINPVNKVQNANFEVTSLPGPFPERWSFSSGQGGTGTYDDLKFIPSAFGEGSFKIDAANTNTYNYSVYLSDPIPVDRTKAYTLSSYVRATQSTGSQNTVLSLIAYNSTNTNLGEFARTDSPGAFYWKRVSGSLAANALPAGTTYVRVKVAASNSTGSGDSRFDGVQLEEGSAATAFVGPVTHKFDRAGMYSNVYDGNGKRTLYRYNENGLTTETTVDPGAFTSYDYQTTYTWDSQNNLLSMKDANANANAGGDSLINTYDTKGNLLDSKVDDGTTSKINNTFTYNNNSDLVTAKDGNANDSTSKFYNSTTEKYHYDARRNPVSAQDALTTSTAASYDSVGNILSETSPMGLADNLMVNSSFERDTNNDSWPDDWNQPTINGTATVNWGATSNIGKKGITISNVSNYVVIGNSVFPGLANQDYYTLSGYAKATTVDAAKAAYLKFDAYDANNILIGQVESNRIGEANQWNKLQVVVWKENLPTGTVKIKPAVVTSATTGTVHFDNIQLEKTPFTSAYNMLDNAGFERGATRPDYWTGTAFSWESVETFSGNKSIKITSPTGTVEYAPDYTIPYDPNKAYTFSGFVKGAGLSNPAGAYLKINFYSSTNALLLPAKESNKLSAGNDEWTRLEAHIDVNGAPAGTAFIKPVITAANFTGTAYFDSVRLQEGKITTAYEYNQPDAAGKGGGNYVTKETDPLGYAESHTYDPATGNKTSTTDAKGNTTGYSYDSLDRLTGVTLPGADLKTGYSYDVNGNLTQVKNSNKAGTVTYNTTSYSYNELDLLGSVTDPLNYVTTFRYNAAGQNSSIDYPNNHKVGYGYNSANRLSSISFDGSTKYTLGYDPNGNLTSVGDSVTSKTWGYAYDKADRLTKVTGPDGSTQENTYDKNSNRLTQKVTVGTSVYNTSYVHSITDKNIELTDHNNNKSRFAYDEKDNLIQFISGNGAAASYQYDGADRSTKVTNTKADGSILSSFSYSYDPNGNRTGVTDHTGKNISYTYDSLNQLLSETDPLSNNTINYTFDALGNRKTKVVKDPSGNVLSTVNYGYDAANRLTSVNGQVYGYDQNGNLLDDGNKTYTWDADGRLIEVRKKADNSLIAQYEYDADGRRVKSVVNGVVTNFHYDGTSIRVLYETDGAGALTTLYTYSDDGLLLSMTKAGQGTYYYHYNAHGDVVQLTDQNGNVAAGYTYDAWGNILSSTGAMAASNPYRYAKYRYDSETGLYYLINRYYNPNVGRFISKEPYEVSSGDLPTINAYTYTQNNPVNAIDPDGNFLWFVAVGAYYAWSVYDSYRDVQTLRSTSASREDRAWAAIGLIGSVVPGGKAAKIVKKGSKTYKVLRHAKFKKATIKRVVSKRTFKQLLRDIDKNPKLWRRTHRSVINSTKKGNKGGLSIEEEYTNIKTGEKIYKHILKDKNGKLIEKPHYRPFSKQ